MQGCGGEPERGTDVDADAIMAVLTTRSRRDGLVKDGVEFMPAAAVKMARSTVVRAAAADLARTRCDGAALTRAAWAARWSGLARLRRDAAKFATGYEIIDGW